MFTFIRRKLFRVWARINKFSRANLKKSQRGVSTCGYLHDHGLGE